MMQRKRQKKHFLALPLLVFGAFFIGLFMTACPEPPFLPPLNNDGLWAYNYTTQKYYRVPATKLIDGVKCEIWAENGSGVTAEQAQAIADEYDNIIEDLVLDNFGIENFEYEGSVFANVMDFAYWLTDSEKLLIFLLDIKDGFNPQKPSSYVAGYFDPRNFYKTNNSNAQTMIYIDTYPGLSEIDQAYETFAHEFQHLASYAADIVREAQLDTWIDEGMSTMAEYFYRNDIRTQRYEWFVDDVEGEDAHGNIIRVGTMAKGNNFYVWGNHNENSLSILDEYATAYMFFQWLYLQSDKDTALFKNINGSAEYSDYRAVTGVAKEINSKWNSWETLLRDWLAANYINDSESEYGYKGEFKDKDGHSELVIRTPAASATHTLDLYPGEGVYSRITSDVGFVPGNLSEPGNIRYAGLQKDPSVVNASTPPYTGEALLTFNANDKQSDSAETAYLTGHTLIVPPHIPGKASIARAVLTTEAAAHPRAVDARDLIGRQQVLPLIKLNDNE